MVDQQPAQQQTDRDACACRTDDRADGTRKPVGSNEVAGERECERADGHTESLEDAASDDEPDWIRQCAHE